MQLFTTKSSLEWGELDVPMLGISSDWFGAKLNPPIGFSLVADPNYLWFVAMREASIYTHPHAHEWKFFPELWKYDVSEIFLCNPETGEYLEFNLAANGAWWAAKFDAPRVASPIQPNFEIGIESFFDDSDDNLSWTCALRIPLVFLKEQIDFGLGTTGNASFIMNTPEQTFHTATKFPEIEPDFHLPSRFPKLIPCPLPAV